MPRTRRDVLGTVAATAGTAAVAGCLVIGDRDERDGDEDDRSDAVAVGDVSVRPEVVALDSPDSYGVFGGRAEQYVVADVTVEDTDAVGPSDLVVETDGETYDTTVEIGRAGGRLAEFGRAYDGEDDDTGWVAARLPTPLDAGSAALAWDGGEYAFDASTLDRLNRPPTEFDVAVEAPKVASVGDDVTVTVTVVNAGDEDGTFVAALNRVGPRVAYAPEAAVVLPVESGQLEEWEYTFPLDDPEITAREDPFVRFHLEWRDGSSTRETTITTE